MSYTLNYSRGEPYFIVTVNSDYSVDDLDSLISDVRNLLDKSPIPLFYISDISKHTPSFDDIVQTVNMLARGEDAILMHPNIKEHLLVPGPNYIGASSTLGLDSPTFGNIKSIIFTGLDEAIKYAKQS